MRLGGRNLRYVTGVALVLLAGLLAVGYRFASESWWGGWNSDNQVTSVSHLTSLIVPSQIDGSQRHVLYVGVDTRIDDSLIHTRVCIENYSCVVQRTVPVDATGESWVWIGAIPAGTVPGEYLGEVYLMEPDERGYRRSVDQAQWILTVE